jgi:hypothetical protein
LPTADRNAGLGVLGVGAAACAACCAGPILGFLAATGIASVLGAAVFGIVGLVVVLAVAVVVHVRRRRRRPACATPTSTGPAPVDAPTAAGPAFRQAMVAGPERAPVTR